MLNLIHSSRPRSHCLNFTVRLVSIFVVLIHWKIYSIIWVNIILSLLWNLIFAISKMETYVSLFILIAIVELYKNILIRDHASSISAMFDLWDSTIYSNKKYRMCTSIKHFGMSFRGSTIPLERLFFIHQRDLGLFQWFLQERQECECSIQEFVVTSICIRNSKHLQWNLWIRNCISFVDFFIL